MAYKHGVQVSEVPTSILPPVSVSAGIPFVVGTAPVNMADPSNVNKPVLVSNYAEAVEAFGYVPPALDETSGLKKYAYSLSEAIYSQFALYGVGPMILVNVLDPTTHKKTAATTSVTLDAKTGSATIAETGIIPDSVKLSASGGSTYASGSDYVMAFNDDGNLVITSLKGTDGNFLCDTAAALTFSASVLDPTKVEADDIVGGVSVDGKKSGLELISECFPRFRLVPGIIAAPGFSQSPTVAAIMAAKATSISNCFKATLAVCDVPTDTVKRYSDVAAWKNDNNIVDPMLAVCWPMLSLDGVAFHQSTQLMGLIGQVDSENADVPYVSPSNHNYQMTAAILADGSEVWLDKETAEYLNGQGVVTALNFIGGWKCWGNRTACYPGVTDVKDAFIPIRRMFSWIGNTLVQTYWQKLDAPLLPRHVQTIVDSCNIMMNGWTAAGYILGGRVEFLESENPATDLMDGIARFHVYVTPPSPNRQIDFVLEYSADAVNALFS